MRKGMVIILVTLALLLTSCRPFVFGIVQMPIPDSEPATLFCVLGNCITLK